ncbi:hypothetical protein SUGI_0110570 [Cryptomeria japonica]|uniref:uncharacterized protein LOC131078842 n=1 Tax=Cryptomeria japonica TaxID=3369 RepID=UPI002408EF15|nr:uncharacterized protein LOC131078842 [Cryptomeria japonica]GLJ09490.1 hypothetical protein SUGI_0110570 [Cryptomeria japonica]
MARWIAVASFGTAGVRIPGSYLSKFTAVLALVAGVVAVVTVVSALCAKNSRKEGKSKNPFADGPMDSPPRSSGNFKLPPRSPARAIIDTISSKKILLGGKGERNEEGEMKAYDRAVKAEGGFLWQKGIIMGERCQPPDFSGVIIYDNMGNLLPEFPPRSPRLNLFHPSPQANATLVR